GRGPNPLRHARVTAGASLDKPMHHRYVPNHSSPTRDKGSKMRTTQVSQAITQLTRMHFVNAFLVREDDGLTLVDTTMGGAADALIEAARAAGGEIRRIALTH